jgi:hypothetical protein
MRTGCVIQGDIRRGTSQILQELPRKFDFTVLSTWVDDEQIAPPGDYSLVVSEKPRVGGLSNRNFQRLSAAKGIQAAKDFGCDYILKWRTDMLPTRLDVNQLLNWANYKIPNGMQSRLVMPAFRNLSVEPDWFSSIPDLFAFGHIEEMEMLWGDSKFDYSLEMNLPNQMSNELMNTQSDSSRLADLYSAESELYSIFRSRLQTKQGIELDHPTIAKNYFRLFDYQRLGIYWFGREQGFRSIGQAWEHPWWTESTWQKGNAKVVPCGYPVSGLYVNLRKSVSPIKVRLAQCRQSVMWGLRKLRRQD